MTQYSPKIRRSASNFRSSTLVLHFSILLSFVLLGCQDSQKEKTSSSTPLSSITQANKASNGEKEVLQLETYAAEEDIVNFFELLDAEENDLEALVSENSILARSLSSDYPLVASVPERGEQNVSTHTPITATFNQVLDCSPTNLAYVYLYQNVNGHWSQVPTTQSCTEDSTTITITPNQLLHPGSRHFVYFHPILTSALGASELVYWDFYTESEFYLLSKTPEANATEVSLDTTISKSFNQHLDCDNIDLDTSVYAYKLNTVINRWEPVTTGQTSCSGSTLNFDIEGGLEGNSRYLVLLLGSRVTSHTGARLVGSQWHWWIFDTAVPQTYKVMRITPVADARDTTTPVTITLSFIEDISDQGLENSVSLVGPGGPTITGCEVSTEGYRLICQSSPLPVGVDYTIVLDELLELAVANTHLQFSAGSITRGNLVNRSNYLRTYPQPGPVQEPIREGLQGFSNELLGESVIDVNYRFSAYRLTCQSIDVEGSYQEISGLVSFPTHTYPNHSVKGPFSMISLQHGTITENAEAPSQLPPLNTAQDWSELLNGDVQFSIEGTLSLLLASSGYVVATPDYLGYGESSNQFHPYLHAETLASASIDFLRCAKLFLVNEKGVQLNDDLFLAGYSEGGYATIAMQKTIEEELADEFTLKAVAAGAGPYHMSATINDIIGRDDISEVVGLFHILYNTYSELYGSFLTLPEFNSILSSDSGPVTESFREQYNNHQASALSAGAKVNDIYDWVPETPLVLFHAPNDQIVPYFNSGDAELAMKTDSNYVKLIECHNPSSLFPNDIHVGCSIPYIRVMLRFFKISGNLPRDISLDESLNDHLAGYYPLDGDASDLSIFHRNGTVVGATPSMDHLGRSEGAYQIAPLGTTTNHYIELPETQLETEGQYSVSVWIKRHDAGDLTIYPVVTKEKSYHIFYFNNYLYVHNYNEGTERYHGPAVSLELPPNEWHHIGVKQDYPYVTVYHNGRPKPAVRIANNVPRAPQNRSHTRLGALDASFHNLSLQGGLNNVRFYDVVLDNEDFLEIYEEERVPALYFADSEDTSEHHPPPRSRPSPIAFYPFNGNADDATGHGNNATPHTVGPEYNRAWQEGAAYLFLENEQSHITIPRISDSSAELSELTRLTLSVWMRLFDDISSEGIKGILRSESGYAFYIDRRRLTFTIASENHPESCQIEREVPSRTWVNTVVTVDLEEIQFYVNGNFWGKCTRTGRSNILLGAHTIGEYQENYFDGTLDDIGIYVSTLTAEEVRDLYFSPFLQAYYPLELDALDYSGRGNDAVIDGALKAFGHIGDVPIQTYFLNTGRYLKVLDPPELQNTGLTLAAWTVYLDEQEVVGLIENTNQYSFYIANGHLALDVGGQTFQSTNTLPTHFWQHVAVTLSIAEDGERSAIFYVNGQDITSEEVTPARSFVGNESLNIGLSIRERADGESQYFYHHGAFKDVRIYNYPLLNPDIVEFYNHYIGMAGFYAFEDNAKDTSGHQNDGSIIGPDFVQSVDRIPFVDEAYLFFNPTLDPTGYISVPENHFPQEDTRFSISIWVETNPEAPPPGEGAASPQYSLISKHNLSETVYELSLVGNTPKFYFPPIGRHEADAELKPGKWNHLVVTYNQHKLKFYLNGLSIGTTVAHPGPMSNWEGVTSIGKNACIPGDCHANSRALDNIRFFNESLSPEAVQQLHDLELPIRR